MPEQNVLYLLNDGVAEITLNRPEKLNAFNLQMHQDLRQAMDQAEQHARAILLTGSGRGFCAGQDLEARAVRADGAAPDLGASLEQYYNPLVRRLQRCPIPIVCAVNGVAAGAGANLALATDIVLAARSASFIQAFSRIGLVPDCGGSYFLPRLVGAARARALTLLGEKLTADDAANWGLIWRVVDDEKLLGEARTLAARLAAGPTKAYRYTKQALLASAENGLDAQLELERQLQREVGLGSDYKEGVAAFLEKRPARFTGQ